MFYLADAPQKVDSIHRAICTCFACCYISSSQFKSEVQLFGLRTTVNAFFLLPKQPRFESNIPSNRWYIVHTLQIW